MMPQQHAQRVQQQKVDRIEQIKMQMMRMPHEYIRNLIRSKTNQINTFNFNEQMQQMQASATNTMNAGMPNMNAMANATNQKPAMGGPMMSQSSAGMQPNIQASGMAFNNLTSMMSNKMINPINQQQGGNQPTPPPNTVQANLKQQMAQARQQQINQMVTYTILMRIF